ncbi:MAG: adenosine deaminase [Sphingomonadales bacterium]
MFEIITGAVRGTILSAGILAGAGCVTDAAAGEDQAARYFDQIKDKPPFLRAFLQGMPKGGDLHNHLAGAVYAESYLEWAAEDGLCVDMAAPAILRPDQASVCEGGTLKRARDVLTDDDDRRRLIDALSMRSFVPSAGWSGHDQFFVTFPRMAEKPERLADMVTRAANRAGRQNELYLELMVTLEFARILTLTADLDWAGGIEAAYEALHKAGLGAQLGELVASARRSLDAAEEHRSRVLKCGTEDAEPGCEVEVRYLYQVIRTMPRNFVFAQNMLGFALTQQDERVVGLNLVAPEDYRVALRDYRLHMEMLDYLRRTVGPIDITLHAGELTLGLVRPDYLRSNIRDAIEIGHAKRIGHGIDIVYEDNSPELLRHMAENGIMVEINLTSNDVILGVSGKDHPISLYRAAGVPVALSTDDEGVSRIDLTHEYQRAVQTHGFSYRELKELSRNSITYSFLPGQSLWKGGRPAAVCARGMLGAVKPDRACKSFLDGSEKARLQWRLEARYHTFEGTIGRWPRPQ